MQAIEHPRLGTLRYEPGDGWRGWIRLERFAEYRLEGLEAAEKKLAQRMTDEALPAGFNEGDEPEDPADEEADEDAQKRSEGYLQIWLADAFGGGRITPAQERSIEYLLDHQDEVLAAVTRHVFDGYRRQLHDLRDFHGQGGDDGTLDDIVPEIDTPEELKRLLAFGELMVTGEPVEGHTPLEFYFSCTWDEEHGGEVHVLRGRVLDPDQPRPDPFPCPLPGGVDTTNIPPEPDGRRFVELQIHGSWSGIYAVDDEGNCTGVVNRCPLCRGEAWDPEGVESAREVPKWHRRLASLPHHVLLPTALGSISLFSPVLMLLGFLAWPGLLWGSLVLPAASLGLLLCYRTYRWIWFRPLTWFALLQAGISASMLYAWHRYGSLDGGSTLAVLGWILWATVACLALLALGFSGMLAAGIGRDAGIVTPALLAPFLLFAGLVGTELWYTATGEFSKFHLLWMVPVTFMGSVFVGLITTIWVTQRLGRRLEQSDIGRFSGN